MSETTELVYVTDIKTTPELLWRALTEEEFTKQYWFGSRIETTWALGAPVSFWMPLPPGEAQTRGMQTNEAGETLATIGEVLIYAPFETLSYTFKSLWDEEARADVPTLVTFTLEPIADGMRLTVLNQRIPNRPRFVEGLTSGWTAVTANLKALLESGAPSKSPAEFQESSPAPAIKA